MAWRQNNNMVHCSHYFVYIDRKRGGSKVQNESRALDAYVRTLVFPHDGEKGVLHECRSYKRAI